MYSLVLCFFLVCIFSFSVQCIWADLPEINLTDWLKGLEQIFHSHFSPPTVSVHGRQKGLQFQQQQSVILLPFLRSVNVFKSNFIQCSKSKNFPWSRSILGRHNSGGGDSWQNPDSQYFYLLDTVMQITVTRKHSSSSSARIWPVDGIAELRCHVQRLQQTVEVTSHCLIHKPNITWCQ